MTSMIKGFKLEVGDAVEIVDKLTKLDMVSATSSGGLARAMQNVASSAQLANVSMDKTLAYAATIIETTQRDESSVGMALRTILARYGNVKAGAYSGMNLAATSDEDLENLNDVEKVLKKIGITIRSSATEFKSFETVLEEVGDKWERLDSVSRNAIATAFAGQRQREAFLVLMNNMDRVEKLAEISANATGTATEKYAAYYETIEEASKRLQTSWEDLSHSFETSGVVKAVTSFLTFIIENAPRVIKYLTAIGTQMNAWRIPTLFAAAGKATGLSALKGLKGTGGSTLLRQRWAKQSEKEAQWKKETLASAGEKDWFGFKTKLSSLSNNLSTLIDAVDRNTAAINKEDSSGRSSKNLPSKKRRGGKKVQQDTRQDIQQDTQQDTQQNTQQDTPGNLLKGRLVTNALSGLASGAVAGLVGGVQQEGSTEAKIASGVIQGAGTAIGGVLSTWLGPLGTILGGTIGEIVGNKVAEAIDREANERKKQVELGQKQLESLSSISRPLEALESSSRIEKLSANDISSIRDAVDSINKQVSSDDDNYKKYVKGAFEALGAEGLFEDRETKLITGTQEERRTIIRALDLAHSEAETEAYKRSMAEKRFAGFSSAELKAYNRQLDEAEVKRAYIRSGVSEESKYSLAQMGVEEVISRVAKQLEGVELQGIRLYDSFGNLTKEADTYIRVLMKADDQMRDILEGQTLTLKEALGQNNTNLLKQFATALGVSVDKLGEFSEKVGSLTLGDFLLGMGETREKISTYSGLLSEFFSTGTITPENLESIISSFPDLINKITEPQEFLSSVLEKISQLGTQYVSAGIDSWFSSEAVYDEIKGVFESQEGFAEIFSESGWLGNVKTLEDAKTILLRMLDDDSVRDKAQQLYNYIVEAGDEAQQELEFIAKQLREKSQIESLMNTFDKQLQKQIDSLQEQKSALEDINSQREYENKLIEAKIKLENAQNEKKKVWREGVGWVYEADTSAIAEAQQELEELENQKTIEELQAQINELQARREYAADIPDKLELEQAAQNFKEWANKLGIVNDDQLTIVQKLEEVYKGLKTRTNGLEGDSQAKGQFGKVTEAQIAATKALVGERGTLSTPEPESVQGKLESAFKAYSGLDETDNSKEAQEIRAKYADALNTYQEAYKAYIDTGGSVTPRQKELNELKAETVPKWNVFDKTYFGTLQEAPIEEWAKGKPNRVALISPENRTAKDAGISNFADLQTSKYEGQLFVNTASKRYDHLFWVHNRKIYKATMDEGQYGATGGVNNRAGGNRQPEDYVLLQDSFKLPEEAYDDTYATGTLSASGGPSLVNDDARYGLEGIITPQGTLTALPSKSGVVPADMTRNVWQLGELAPNLIKHLVDIDSKVSSPNGFGTDESFNVEHLDIHMVAQPGFNMDDFVRELEAARNQTRHL